jgi:hypothetical protein
VINPVDLPVMLDRPHPGDHGYAAAPPPRFRGIKQIAIAAYDHVLAPLIYRWHLRRVRKGSTRKA